MPKIAIDQSTFERLQSHAKPLVDTSDSVIIRALDALERDMASSSSQHLPSAGEERAVDVRKLPNVTHTKILDASMQGKRVDKPNWNLLQSRILVQAMRQLSDFEAVQKLCPVNIVRGVKGDEGYCYLPEAGLSFQRTDANDALRSLVTTAQGLGIAVEIGFMWRQKEGAAYPGERGRVRVLSRAS